MQTQSKSGQTSEVTQQNNKKQPDDLCHLGCNTIVQERNRYYTGKYMTAHDFELEQDYVLSHLRFHNRLLGWGIVHGLQVIPHDQPDCNGRYVVICPGVALDCCGRELVIDKKVIVDVWSMPKLTDAEINQLLRATEKEQVERDEAEENARRQEEVREHREEEEHKRHERHEHEDEEHHVKPIYIKSGGRYLIALRYDEEAREWAPALYSDQSCDSRHLEANRIRELVRVESHNWNNDRQRYAGCWPDPEAKPESERQKCQDDCVDKTRPECAGNVEADCPCEGIVPLALVEPVFDLKARRWIIPYENIDLTGRHELGTKKELTHIVHCNWKHGGDLSLLHLRDHEDGKLRIYFDRRLLHDPERRGIGVNRHTFVVTIHRRADVQYSIQELFYDEHPPYVENTASSCCAIFPIDPRMLSGDIEMGDNTYLYITLKCDFILDCHDRPVDGDHLRGNVPTGNGVEGGTFESWVRIVNDLPRRRPYGRAD